MPTFLAVFTGSEATRKATGWDAMDEETRGAREASAMKAWGEWMTANDAAIVDSGGPLGSTKRISPKGIADITNSMAGYVILQAESHEAAAIKFRNHPHFAIFPGDAVEVMECLPIPGR